MSLAVRRTLLEKFGPSDVKIPTGPGLWLVHRLDYIGQEPTFIVVVEIQNELYFRKSRDPDTSLDALSEWVTSAYPEADVLCWEIPT